MCSAPLSWIWETPDIRRIISESERMRRILGWLDKRAIHNEDIVSLKKQTSFVIWRREACLGVPNVVNCVFVSPILQCDEWCGSWGHGDIRAAYHGQQKHLHWPRFEPSWLGLILRRDVTALGTSHKGSVTPSRRLNVWMLSFHTARCLAAHEICPHFRELQLLPYSIPESNRRDREETSINISPHTILSFISRSTAAPAFFIVSMVDALKSRLSALLFSASSGA